PTADDEAAAGSEAPQVDLRKMLRRGEQQEEDEATARLNRTQLTQPVLFVVEYALAQLWMEWGILPQALVGYSLGEYVAACLAGVLSLEDALKLVAERARLIGDLPAGSMLAVALPEDELRPLLGPELSLSAVNGPEQSVAAGPEEAIATLERELAAKDVVSRRLQTSHAFHSQMMEPLYDAVAELAAGCALHPPRIPYLSNLTGTWITAEEATDPAYWARHMCQPVRFSTAIEELVSDPQRIFLELGPGGTLASLLLQHPAAGDEPAVMASLRHVYETQSDVAYTLSTLGKLWLLGVPVDWRGFYRHEHRRRLELPTYPFERQRYWIDAVDAGVSHLPPADGRVRFYLPSWQRSPLTTGGDGAVKGQWLLFTDPCGLGSELARRLREAGGTVSTVRPGEGFRRLGEEDFCIAPGTPEDYATLVDELGTPPRCIVHLWSVGEADGGPAEALEHCRELGFDSLLALARALGRRQGEAPVALWVISDGLHDVTGQEALEPAKATVLGACAALGREAPGVACRSVDVLLPGPGSGPPEGLADRLLAEIADASAPLVAYRGHHRWLPALAANDGAANDGERPALLREGGTYLITNGFGGLGRVFAEYLVTTAQARLVLVEPPGFPPREQWDEWLSSDDSEGRISSRIQQLRSWEAAGAQVLATAVELGDRERVRELLAQAKARFGPIRGLVHVAEEAATGSAELGAVRELLVLDELLRDHDPEFCFLVSPLAASDGVAAANHFFLDAFAGYRAGNAGGRWSSITWEVPESGEQSAVLGRLFALAPLPQVIVSARSMAPDWSRLDTLAEAPAPAPAPQGFYPRPSLRVEYAAPRSDQERAVVEIWQQLLGVGQVGIHDSFLDLGGDSLLAARLVTRMRSVFDLELPIRLLFEASTVAELVAAVERMREQEEEREMREMLERIKQLPEEELEQEIRMRQSDD
ncbi:MAG: acyltransferase domain-containing protein, partial [bacterium]|nr:acyltransferase domain-containing protein [bacterium]